MCGIILIMVFDGLFNGFQFIYLPLSSCTSASFHLDCSRVHLVFEILLAPPTPSQYGQIARQVDFLTLPELYGAPLLAKHGVQSLPSEKQRNVLSHGYG